jgi:hypothetical protein
MQNPSTLVMGTAFRCDVKDVWVFVESLRRHYQGEVLLLISSRYPQLARYLTSRNVLPVFFDAPYWMRVHVQVGRYVRYGELLRGSPKIYDRILLTDVTDVVFQGHPFIDLPPGELLFFMEHAGRPISSDQTNAMWVNQVYGPRGLELIKDKPISCSGTTIGAHQPLLEYIDLLLKHANPEVLARYPEYRGHDQGIHNYLLHTGALPHVQMIPNARHVYTMGAVPEDQIQLGPAGTILGPQGRTPSIVHQYTYHPRTAQHVRSAIPAPA